MHKLAARVDRRLDVGALHRQAIDHLRHLQMRHAVCAG